jgi:hypothetical protein
LLKWGRDRGVVDIHPGVTEVVNGVVLTPTIAPPKFAGWPYVGDIPSRISTLVGGGIVQGPKRPSSSARQLNRSGLSAARSNEHQRLGARGAN